MPSGASDASKLRGFVDGLDAVDGVDVVTMPRELCVCGTRSVYHVRSASEDRLDHGWVRQWRLLRATPRGVAAGSRGARATYERERREIDQIDAVIRSLDQLRVDAGISKAELARRIGRNPSSIRRLFTAQRARPELPLIVSIADELGARVEIAVRSPGSARAGRKRAAA